MMVFAGAACDLTKLSGKSLPVCLLLSAFCASLAAQTATPTRSLSQNSSGIDLSPKFASVPELPDYIISPDDILGISVYDAPDVSGEYRVGPTGQLELPLLAEAVKAAGLTTAQLSRLLIKKYGEEEIFTNARVTVAVKQSRIHSITVAGAVKSPQIYPLFGKTTLLDVLSQAGGLSNDARNIGLVNRGGGAS